MASTCVNNIGMSPENFLDCSAAKYTSYGWLSPRISFSREIAKEEANKTTTGVKPPSPSKIPADHPEESDPDPEVSGNDLCDFEFRLEDLVTMLPADELFSNGKLVPLRSSKASNSGLDSFLNIPLLNDSDNESSISISSRLSLSSSFSGHDHDDLLRRSLDSDKPSVNTTSHTRNPNPNPNPPGVRVVKLRSVSSENNPVALRGVGQSPLRRQSESTSTAVCGVSVDSPHMNSSGKIMFHSLERSSSSPSSFNGGP